MSDLESHQQRLAALVHQAPIIPVVTIQGPEQAVNLARVLSESGLNTIEVTLRTEGAMEGLRAIKAALPTVRLGAGTVLDEAQMAAAARAGCSFAVSPGATDRIIAASLDADLPLLPGASTPSETQWLLEQGIRLQKFFPSEPSGGLAYLNALAGPYAHVRFCPTGGIHADNVEAYLATPNVACVGGSWMAPAGAVADSDWDTVRALSKTAARTGEDARANR